MLLACGSNEWCVYRREPLLYDAVFPVVYAGAVCLFCRTLVSNFHLK